MDNEPDEQIQPIENQKSKSRKWQIVILVVSILCIGLVIGFLAIQDNDKQTPQADTQSYQPLREPNIATEVLVEGHSNIWDTAFIDEDTLLYTVRSGEIWAYSLSTKEKWQLSSHASNVRAEGEGGLLGLAIDTQQSDTGFVCYNAAGSQRSVHVARFTISADRKTMTSFADIITDIESQAGRHSGCRMQMDEQAVLWVGTGDSALRTAPQNPKSLAGKVLRVDRDGKAVAGNLPEPFDPRIYNYGHRNIQGITLFDSPAPNGAVGLTAEHGSDRDDEINWLLPGNFGWDPAGPNAGYDESVPMTDKEKYPQAINAVWDSGSSTIAISDVTVLKNERWQAWRNQILLAVLKDRHVRLIHFLYEGRVTGEDEILNEFGRIRSLTEAPNGDLLISTDNGGGKDKIVRVIPE